MFRSSFTSFTSLFSSETMQKKKTINSAIDIDAVYAIVQSERKSLIRSRSGVSTHALQIGVLLILLLLLVFVSSRTFIRCFVVRN